MTGLEIVLIVTGAIIFIASFFVNEKLSSSDIEYIQKMSEKEVKIILDRELGNAENAIDKKISEKTEEAVEEIERATDRDTNEKLLSMNEFSDTVLDSMNKTHSEITFLYSMLGNKEKKIEGMEEKLSAMENSISGMKAALEKDMKQLNIDKSAFEQDKNAFEQAKTDRENEEKEREEKKLRTKNDLSSLKEAFENRLNEEKKETAAAPKSAIDMLSGEKLRDNIQKLHQEGLSEVEIAKKLGKGLVEVKLYLKNFEGENGGAAGEPEENKS